MIEELRALAVPQHWVRIAPEVDVPLTPRVTRLLDSPPLRRLARVSQLGLVSQVYPGAIHHRLEHSLGVYRHALEVLSRLLVEPGFASNITERQAGTFVAASLLHDVGHWPFCHPIEDMQLAGLPRHEVLARDWLEQPEMAALVKADWSSVDEICDLLSGRYRDRGSELLGSLLSGPIDIDKMDYLVRDSLHAGVPYGRHFDIRRLLGSLVPHPELPRMALGEKGRTAAEMMVFARYVMFSEVYWHHAVRSATAMLQRAVYMLQGEIDLVAMTRLDDHQWIASLCRAAEGTAAEPLVSGLFGDRRQLWKRVAEFDRLQHGDLHAQLARRPYGWLVRCSEALAGRLARDLGVEVGLADVLIDAPPVKLEVDINMDVVRRDGSVCPLGEISPVVEALARRQFDNHVKRVRVFVRPDIRKALEGGQLDEKLLEEAAKSVGE